jgi:ribosomal protein S18 acetylase RimI-like enzyme
MIELDAHARIRRAGPSDVAALLAIKRALPMPSGRPRTRTGGFLLGADEAGYALLLAVGQAWLLEVDGAPVGFALTLTDPVLRASPVWSRREAIRWADDFDPEPWLAKPIGYFDQLALLPDYRERYWGAALGLRALAELVVEQRHAMVLTTTVVEPILNVAPLPLLRRLGAREVGRLAEHYPEVGAIVSAVHAIEAVRATALLREIARRPPPSTAELLEPFVQAANE